MNLDERREVYDFAALALKRASRAEELLAEAPREWIDDADLFVKYTSWLARVTLAVGRVPAQEPQ